MMNQKIKKNAMIILVFIVWILLFAGIIVYVIYQILLGVDFTSIILVSFCLLIITSFTLYFVIVINNEHNKSKLKLNELARISEKIDSEQTFKEALSLNIKYIEKLIPETENTEQNGKIIIEEKNYKFELYKKYMDTLADI